MTALTSKAASTSKAATADRKDTPAVPDMTDTTGTSHMTPAQRGEMAKAYFKEGYSCAQAVLLAFPDLTGLDEGTAARLGSSFGGGMGRMREVCGAVSGALMVLGFALGYDDPKAPDAKNAHYARVRDFAARFRERSGGNSILCRELLSGVPHTEGGDAEARTSAYYRKRPCPELCALAAEIAGEMLAEADKS